MNKLIISALLVFGLVGMIGTAAADPYNLRIYNTAGTAPADNPLQLLPGDSIVLSLYMEKMANDSDTFPITTLVSSIAGSNPADVTVSLATGVLTPSGADPYTQVGEVTITLSPSAPVGAQYNIQVSAPGANPLDIGVASRNVNSIPEFPTVALPIAAILGLMFIISSRKKEE
ncbi:MAG: PEF-CTERM sorting domain-containing protein [ANME-2 cluster archaeon]|nr:PEF-CTERM sorting domain-containing protein [ANME-2 cluster archaeon]